MCVCVCVVCVRVVVYARVVVYLVVCVLWDVLCVYVCVPCPCVRMLDVALSQVIPVWVNWSVTENIGVQLMGSYDVYADVCHIWGKKLQDNDQKKYTGQGVSRLIGLGTMFQLEFDDLDDYRVHGVMHREEDDTIAPSVPHVGHSAMLVVLPLWHPCSTWLPATWWCWSDMLRHACTPTPPTYEGIKGRRIPPAQKLRTYSNRLRVFPAEDLPKPGQSPFGNILSMSRR